MLVCRNLECEKAQVCNTSVKKNLVFTVGGHNTFLII